MDIFTTTARRTPLAFQTLSAVRRETPGDLEQTPPHHYTSVTGERGGKRRGEDREERGEVRTEGRS